MKSRNDCFPALLDAQFLSVTLKDLFKCADFFAEHNLL